MDATGAKWIALIVLGLVSFTLGMIPIKISSALRWTRHGCQRSPTSQLVISALLCFGAGVLLATSLTHMLPEVREKVERLRDSQPPFLQALPLTEVLLAMGFFLVYGLDEVVHTALYRSQHASHNHSAAAQSSSSQDNTNVNLATGGQHGHSHCKPSASHAEQEPRPSSQNTLLRHSSGQHQYGATDCKQEAKDDAESLPLLQTEVSEGASPLTATSGLLALLALSIHAVTEGLAVGLQSSAANVFFLFGAVATHKFVIAFCLGMEMSSGWGAARASLKFHTAFMSIFAGMSALGIIIGMLLMGGDEPDGLFIQALQALAAGTLLYVTFFEVLPRERAKCHAGLLQFFSVLVGFLVMLTLDTAVPHDDLPDDPFDNSTIIIDA